MVAFDPTAPETWHPIPGFPAYQISSRLRLKSFHQGNRRLAYEGRIIKIHADPRGYGKLMLWHEGKFHNRYLHRVVAELAMGPIPDGLEVLHRDDDKTNNWPDNLYFGTPVQNVADCKANGHFVVLKGEQRANAKLDDNRVRAIQKLAEYGVDRGVLVDCFEIDRSTICRILHGQRWPHVG